MVEGSPRCHWPHTRRGCDRPRRLVTGPGRAGTCRKAGTDNRMGRAIRVDLAGAAVAARVRPGDDRHWAHLLLWTGRGSGLGLDLARRGGGHHPLAVGVASLQVVYRQLHGLRSFVRHGRRGHRRPSLVLHIRYRHPCGRGTQRRNRTHVSVRESARAKERARKAAHRAEGGARISRTSTINRIAAWSLRSPGLQAHNWRRGRNEQQHHRSLFARCRQQNTRRRAMQISSASL